MGQLMAKEKDGVEYVISKLDEIVKWEEMKFVANGLLISLLCGRNDVSKYSLGSSLTKSLLILHFLSSCLKL